MTGYDRDRRDTTAVRPTATIGTLTGPDGTAPATAGHDAARSVLVVN
jgi:hypothetical protein